MTKAEEDVKQEMGASSFEHGGMKIEGGENGMKIGVLADTHLIEPIKDAEEIL
jgi:hypothetical protein